MKNEKEFVVEDSNHCNLLAGYKDKDGQVHTNVEYEGITGEVEEEISKADVKRNGGRIINTLLEKCVYKIGDYEKSKMSSDDWAEIIKGLYVADQDWLVLNIRKYSDPDSEIEVTHQCPNPRCQEENRVFVDIDELEITEFNGKHELSFELPVGFKKEKKNGDVEIRKKGKLRLPKGEDREVLVPVAQRNLAKGNTMMMTRCVTQLGGKQVHDGIFRKMMSRDRGHLLDILEENSFGVDLSVETSCSYCGRKFDVNLNVVNFI
jgi:hypothetical protein